MEVYQTAAMSQCRGVTTAVQHGKATPSDHTTSASNHSWEGGISARLSRLGLARNDCWHDPCRELCLAFPEARQALGARGRPQGAGPRGWSSMAYAHPPPNSHCAEIVWVLYGRGRADRRKDVHTERRWLSRGTDSGSAQGHVGRSQEGAGCQQGGWCPLCPTFC